ncbi:radical SAM protein [Candidatus Aminicenantes bacterium AC-708-M15]|jgi:MoaA/NifB/PqqE/SkfB family radical SAM enzyme|nr:radical SAM protein [SCandidatus Aminicenantes bacterium Aminicenantia_JdfR_composite]MCP2597401.1 radical SAM protein [Candidatus Aminicenantes bacterium AC-335-G13]MCP2598208.1 radical SAM protein [Candidatus Aminicenantes bacterium AC-335-L06]MCP2603959.1 radical SAM protein [Candidatus Aminicenantes bacterium AC-708-M15]MCP2605585.1 radical SAM protein [Candidatus Aminicenantes bacterium AC-335-O07]
MSLKKLMLQSPFKKIILLAFINRYSRKLLFKIIENSFYKTLLLKDIIYFPRKLQEDKFYMLKSIINALDRGIKEGLISKKIISQFLNSFGNIYFKEKNKLKNFESEYGFKPPAFVTISPTKFCNLNCTGCYANSFKKAKEKLGYKIVSRIIREQKELWGSHFTVISGGEPLAYKSNGKTIFDLAEEHNDTFFLMYTNGTLINEQVAEKFAELGNITPAISVEGFEKETDERRGKGVFKKILKAFENLRKHGVPFGISITATRFNADLILSEEFVDFYFYEQGALYGWIFQYMPIGRSYNLDLMVTPQQRLQMYFKTWEYIKGKGLFLADFWNCGAVSTGCISAGREGGYLYIDWNGNVMPCVFNPYTADNIIEVYKKGGNLNTILFSSFFKGIREWQKEYVLEKSPSEMGNIIIPCAIRDHYEIMYELIRKTGAKPANKDAEQALQDPEYYKRLMNYGEELRKITDEIWEKEYLEPERLRLEFEKNIHSYKNNFIFEPINLFKRLSESLKFKIFH